MDINQLPASEKGFNYLIAAILRLRIISSYSDVRRIGNDDWVNDYLTIYGILDDYIYRCLLRIHEYNIKEHSLGYIKLRFHSFTDARWPRQGFFIEKDSYIEYRLWLLASIMPFYDREEHVENSNEKTTIYKQLKEFSDLYEIKKDKDYQLFSRKENKILTNIEFNFLGEHNSEFEWYVTFVFIHWLSVNHPMQSQKF